MKKTKFIFLFASLAFVVLGLTTQTGFSQDQKPWDAPASAKANKNPLKSNADNLDVGKNLYAKHCRSCHGKSGEGDGPKAAELKTPTGDFTTAKFQAQTDGELFYKTNEGRDDMPSFKKKIPDSEDVWAVILYLRTLKSK